MMGGFDWIYLIVLCIIYIVLFVFDFLYSIFL